MVTDTFIRKYIHPMTPIPTGMSPQGRPRGNLRCILFDVYGTLFISGSGDLHLARKAASEQADLATLFSRYGITASPAHIQERYHAAIETSHAASRASGISFPEVNIESIWASVLRWTNAERVRQFAAEYEMLVNPVYPMPHLTETLSTCRQKGIRMGIVSNAQFYTPYLFRWFLNRPLAQLGFTSRLVLFSYRYRRAKPGEGMFQIARERLETLGIAAKEALYVGNDMRNDIRPARTTGFQTALFAGDKRSLRLRQAGPMCEQVEPDMIITDLRQVIPAEKFFQG